MRLLVIAALLIAGADSYESQWTNFDQHYFELKCPKDKAINEVRMIFSDGYKDTEWKVYCKEFPLQLHPSSLTGTSCYSYMYACMYVYMYVCMCVYLSICLSICLRYTSFKCIQQK